MVLITQNAKNLFIKELGHRLWEDSGTRCVVLKLSRLSRKPEDWLSRTTGAIENCLESESRVFACDNGDVMVIAPHADREHFAQLISLLSARLAAPALKKLSFFYELPADGQIVQNHFTGVQEIVMVHPDTAERIPDTDIPGDFLNRSLIGTIGLRRERRSTPEILVVEDDVFFQHLIDSFSLRSFRVTMARSGADALDIYTRSAPDMVFLNIGLPDASGFDILAKILEYDPNAYIVILSGQASRENVLRSISLGAKGFIGKPFTAERLLSCIGHCPFVQEKRMKGMPRRRLFQPPWQAAGAEHLTYRTG